jgi:hypothetical protein
MNLRNLVTIVTLSIAQLSYGESAFFEKQLALSALEWSNNRGFHNEFLSGYLFDSSVDNALYIEEMPLNLPINGQGQGYINTNFLIEELFDGYLTRRGPYYGEDGDFTSGGSSYIDYQWPEDSHQITVGIGENRFNHTTATGQFTQNEHNLTYGFEVIGQDIDPDLRNSSAANGSNNAVLKYQQGNTLNGFQISGMWHESDWASKNPRTIERSRMGDPNSDQLLDANAKEDSHRYSISASGWRVDSRRRWYWSAYVIDYEGQLDLEFLFGNRNGARVRPIQRVDNRIIYGTQLRYDRFFTRTGDHSFGVQLRRDEIKDVGLSDVIIGEDTPEEGDADLSTGALYYINRYQWNKWLQHELALRLDTLSISADNTLNLDYAKNQDMKLSPKLSLLAKPWDHTEFFASIGRGIHSNDARYSYRGINTFRNIDNPPPEVDPLASIDAIDIGFSSYKFDKLLISSSLWYRRAETELAARNAAVVLRPSRRHGIEFRVQYQPNERYYADFSTVISDARFDNHEPQGNHIPGSTEKLAALDVGYIGDKYYVGLTAYYLGPSPVREDNQAKTEAASAVDLKLGRRFGKHWAIELQWLNIFDQDRNNPDLSVVDQIAAAEAFIEEFYYQPIPPQTLRLYLRYSID